ncbi:hypothetical protein [Streptomyces sp. Ru73]|uniref:hypothetical protein n=1 Tax=Streptomyces sp. Ru73 TaxID=2080748 RepID=UPI0011B0DEA1|nr:hypothetical protein [Streptomyces sp. Ru73]
MKSKRERVRTPDRAVSNAVAAVLLTLVTMAMATWRVGVADAGATGAAHTAGVTEEQFRAWAGLALAYAEACARHLAEPAGTEPNGQFSVEVAVAVSALLTVAVGTLLLLRFGIRIRVRKKRIERSSSRRY